MLLTADAITQVKAAHPIDEVVSRFVVLTRDGYHRYNAHCPLHQERTASFKVELAPDGGHWYCYGCRQGGDVFDFLWKKERLHFLQAFEYLTGLPLVTPTQRHSGYQSRSTLAEQQLVRDVAMAFYQSDLFSESGSHARAYLARRGIAQETARACGLGWCQGGRAQAIQAALAARGIPLAAAHDAGVFQGPQHTERFIGRVVVPEFRAGHAVWLTGRTPTVEVDAVFMNVPGRRMLLGLETLGNASFGILTQGVFDFLTIRAFGMPVIGYNNALPDEAFASLAALQRIYFANDWDREGRATLARYAPLFGPAAYVIPRPVSTIGGHRVKDVNDLVRWNASFAQGKALFLQALRRAYRWHGSG